MLYFTFWPLCCPPRWSTAWYYTEITISVYTVCWNELEEIVCISKESISFIWQKMWVSVCSINFEENFHLMHFQHNVSKDLMHLVVLPIPWNKCCCKGMLRLWNKKIKWQVYLLSCAFVVVCIHCYRFSDPVICITAGH